MTAARIRFAIFVLLFSGWIGYLTYLAATKANPVIVSRSQMLAATHFVLVEVELDPETGNPKVRQTVAKDLRPKGAPLAGEIAIPNIKEARVAGIQGTLFEKKGLYLLPLTEMSDGLFLLTPSPKSPGDESTFRGKPWAYFWDHPDVQKQFDRLVAP
jgi:hypothetical protein